MNRLDEILRAKQTEVQRLRQYQTDLHERALRRHDFRSFRSALQRTDQKPAVIAEIKKASPSAGIIALSFEPVEIARGYERAGADAISILTDEQFFQGKLEYLVDIRRSVSLPLLRKDFVLDAVQVAESAAAGADAILLIAAALDQKKLIELREAAATYQLDAVVEVHTQEELERALAAGADIVGINNRDLTSFAVDLSVTEKLCRAVPDEIVLVSESGIKRVGDIARMEACGVDAILIGEALMRGEISIAEIREL